MAFTVMVCVLMGLKALALPALQVALRDPNPIIRAFAARAMETFSPGSAIAPDPIQIYQAEPGVLGFHHDFQLIP